MSYFLLISFLPLINISLGEDRLQGLNMLNLELKY